MRTNHHSLRALASLGALLVLCAFGATGAQAIVGGNLAEHAAPQGFFVEPEVVFLNFRDGDNHFAVTTPAVPATLTPLPPAAAVTGTVWRVDTDYEAGFRFGLGYRWDNRWHIRVKGTHIDELERSPIVASPVPAAAAMPTVPFISPTRTHPSFPSITPAAMLPTPGVTLAGVNTVVEARGTSDTDFTTIDFEVGRTWGDEDSHRMTYFFGVRHLSYDHDFTAAYTTQGQPLGTFDEVVFDQMDNDSIGVRTGIEGHVALGRDTGWSFFGNFALSGLVGDFDTRLRETSTPVLPAASPVVARVDVRDNFERTILGLEAGIGFEWARVLQDWTFGIRFGYEVANYTDLIANQQWISGTGGAGAAATPWNTGLVSIGSEDLGLDGGFLKFIFTW